MLGHDLFLITASSIYDDVGSPSGFSSSHASLTSARCASHACLTSQSQSLKA